MPHEIVLRDAFVRGYASAGRGFSRALDKSSLHASDKVLTK
jgi:hypothetical protein